MTKDTQKFEGLFTLYQTNEQVYAELKPNQFDQPFLAPIAIARGLAMAGQPLNFGDEWILVFRRVGDNIHLLRRNIHYEAQKGTPLEKAVKQNYTDSVLMSLPIVSLAPNGNVLFDFSQIFLSDFVQLGLGEFDRNRSSWHKIKTFPSNLELEVEATFKGRGAGFRFGDDGVADSRGITVVIHYSICQLPESGYKPRYWYHWGSESMFYGGGVDYPIFERVLSIQRIVLNRCFSPTVLSRLANQELQSNPDAKPLKMSEVFQIVTDAVCGQSGQSKDTVGETIRRNLQREHLSRLCRIVLGSRSSSYNDSYGYFIFFGVGAVPADAKSLARYHLQRIQERIEKGNRPATPSYAEG